MPKLLQKSIFKASINTALLGFLVAMIFVGSILYHGKIATSFNVINLFFIVAEMSIDKKSMLRFELPDYMYIAPYSGDQIQGLIRKGMKYKFMAIYITIFLIVITPVIIYSIINSNVMSFIICIAEAVIIFTSLYSGMHLRYLIKVNVFSYVAIEMVFFLQYVIFAAVADYSNHSGETNHIFEVIKNHMSDVALLGCLMIGGIIAAIFCRVKYFKPMVCYLSDYENIR